LFFEIFKIIYKHTNYTKGTKTVIRPMQLSLQFRLKFSEDLVL